MVLAGRTSTSAVVKNCTAEGPPVEIGVFVGISTACVPLFVKITVPVAGVLPCCITPVAVPVSETLAVYVSICEGIVF